MTTAFWLKPKPGLNFLACKNYIRQITNNQIKQESIFYLPDFLILSWDSVHNPQTAV